MPVGEWKICEQSWRVVPLYERGVLFYLMRQRFMVFVVIAIQRRGEGESWGGFGFGQRNSIIRWGYPLTRDISSKSSLCITLCITGVCWAASLIDSDSFGFDHGRFSLVGYRELVVGKEGSLGFHLIRFKWCISLVSDCNDRVLLSGVSIGFYLKFNLGM